MSYFTTKDSQIKRRAKMVTDRQAEGWSRGMRPGKLRAAQSKQQGQSLDLLGAAACQAGQCIFSSAASLHTHLRLQDALVVLGFAVKACPNQSIFPRGHLPKAADLG